MSSPNYVPADIEAMNARQAATIKALRDEVDFVRMLLWDDFPECCGCPEVGAQYMGQNEMVCCGCPEPALLGDKQIVASLRERFPKEPTP